MSDSKRRKKQASRSPHPESHPDTPDVKSAPESPLSTGPEETTTWSAEEEIALFDAIARFRPLGLHRHLMMVLIVQELQKALHSDKYTPSYVWAHLRTLYNLDTLDESQEDEEEYVQFEEDFSLPAEEFGSLMETKEAETREREKEQASSKKKDRKRAASPSSPAVAPKKRR
eukprot:comp44834_c0_seq1/m.47515 comp44834_c0_seq1/g.47515  ORF comp44834_c0_seq1/g.47515 comp44834_c0_seq1/m.47515 type:complete len:172 (-) comp44834_c0_seq1:332-847(-)